MGQISRRKLFLGTSALAAGYALSARRHVAFAGPTDPIGPFFDSLMRRAEFEMVFDSPDVLQTELPEEGQRAQVTVHRVMREGGFETYATGVYVRQDVKLYVLGHKNGRDICSPVFVGGCFGTMFEGPTVVGLALAAEDWTFPNGISIADGLFPRNTLQHDASWLDESMTKPYHALTAAGDIAIRYESDPDNQVGSIEVLSRQINGEPLFAADYDISW